MPSEREQSVISSKGLMTIPEPYRTYHEIKEGDLLVVTWDRFILVRPKKVEFRPWEEILADLLLSGHKPDAFSFEKIWVMMSEADRQEFMKIAGLVSPIREATKEG